MLYRLARATLTGVLVMGLALTSTAGVAAQSGPDLSISMTGPTRIKSQALVVYTITVTNIGTVTATRIWIQGGGGDQFNSMSMQCPDNGSFGQSGCAPGDLLAGGSVTATYTVSVCCLVRHEDRQAFVGASVVQDVYPNPDPDPNQDNNWAQKDVFIIGGRVK